MYKKILVPLDGSGRAEAILGHVETLAAMQTEQVILLRVLEPPSAIIDPHESRLTMVMEEYKRREEEAKQYLQARAGELRAHDVEVKTQVGYGAVVKVILETAAVEDVGLIAMASHGRSGLGQVFYGSVALGVLHRADRPLLLVRASRDEPRDRS